MHLRDQGIENDDDGGGRVRRADRISDENGGVGRGGGIYNASRVLETKTEAAVARRRDQIIYDGNNDEGVR